MIPKALVKLMLFFVFLMVSTSHGSAQNLTMNELLQMRKMDVGQITDFLTQKKWEFVDASEETENEYGIINFAYEKSVTDDKAVSFINYQFSEELDIRRITIQVNDKTKFNQYLNIIKGFGCKLINSKVVDGKIMQVYQGATTTFIIQSGTSENAYHVQTAFWSIQLRENEKE